MPIVVADTGPINYLIVIDAIDILPTLFDQVFVPQEVVAERTDRDTPAPVRAWIEPAPVWFKIHISDTTVVDESTARWTLVNRLQSRSP